MAVRTSVAGHAKMGKPLLETGITDSHEFVVIFRVTVILTVPVGKVPGQRLEFIRIDPRIAIPPGFAALSDIHLYELADRLRSHS